MNLRPLVLLLLTLCSACGKAEMSEARMSHLLASEHGWVDLVIKSPPSQRDPSPNHECSISFTSNGEVMLRERADFAAASANGTPIGYRFPVPVGKLKIELAFSQCLKNEVAVTQDVQVSKDLLVELSSESGELKLGASSSYIPASLNEVHEQIGVLQVGARESSERTSSLRSLVLAGIVFNALAVVLLLWRRKCV